MGLVLIRAIHWFAEILIMMLFIQCILSWFVQSPASPLFNAYRILTQLTDPFVAPFRKLLSNFNRECSTFPCCWHSLPLSSQNRF